jgi:hypothetical protein
MKSILLSLAGKVIVAIIVLTTLALTTQAQDKKQAPKKAKTEKMKPKEHTCTQACHDSGKHVYAHGEKGHVCTSTCKK